MLISISSLILIILVVRKLTKWSLFISCLLSKMCKYSKKSFLLSLFSAKNLHLLLKENKYVFTQTLNLFFLSRFRFFKKSDLKVIFDVRSRYKNIYFRYIFLFTFDLILFQLLFESYFETFKKRITKFLNLCTDFVFQFF